MDDVSKLPLCVDLDGTLIKTDLLLESLVLFVKHKPWNLIIALMWMLQGKSYLKYRLAQHVSIAVDLLPYNQAVLSYIQQEKDQGRSLFLSSASPEKFVRQIAEYLNIFDGCHYSIKGMNLKAENKAKCLVDEFGANGFDYIGNDISDQAVFQKAKKSYLVTASKTLITKLKARGNIFEQIFLQETHFFSYVKLLRLHHWTKNVLVFLPVLLSHQILNYGYMEKSLVAFALISLLASGTYVINDIFDLYSDRAHERKRKRPIASGEISIFRGISVSLLFILLAFGSCLAFFPQFFIILLAYFVVTLLYSFHFKKIIMVDVLVLAFLYTVRIILGAIAINEIVSQWLFSFSIFLFCSLGLVKRYNEIFQKERSNISCEDTQVPGRGYVYSDSAIIQMLGIALGACSVLIFVLYISSDKVKGLYQVNYWLWLVAPVLLYWLGRLWILTSRGAVNEDPILFSIKDRANYVLLFVIVVCLLFAKYGFNVLL